MRLFVPLLLFALTSYATVSASAHQIHGGPGAPDARITLDGKRLPPPPFKFGEKIGEVAKDSKPYWPPHIVPPEGAPNVLMIISMDGGWTAG